MPRLQLNIGKGTASIDEKRELVKELTDVIERVHKAKRSDIIVEIIEFTADNVSIGGGLIYDELPPS